MTIFLKKTDYGDIIVYRNDSFIERLKKCIYKEIGIFTNSVLIANTDEFCLYADSNSKNGTEMKKVKKYLKEVFNINSKDTDKQIVAFSYDLKWAKPISFKLSDYEMDQCKALLKVKGY